MKCFPSAAAFVLVLSPLLSATPAAAQAPAALQNPQIEIVYGQPSNANYRPIYDRLKKLQVLEELKQFLVPLSCRVDRPGRSMRRRNAALFGGPPRSAIGRE
jgi:hypothetical protein